MAPNKSLDESDASMRKRLVESLSASFPGSALSRALHAMDPTSGMESGGGADDSDQFDDGAGIGDRLSRSCFAELRLEQGALDAEDDDELTSLAWLQDSNLVKSIGGDDRLCMSPTEDGEVSKENEEIGGGAGGGGGGGDGGYAGTHPPNVPYNPQKHVNSKPPYSFSCLIFMAIEDSPIKKLPVKDIYNWILTHFPYFQNAPTGWKNSVRHNLSLNKCFKKVEKEKGQTIGKGSLWCIDPDYRPNLLQALRKTPYHPYHQLQMLATPTPNAGYTILSGAAKPLPLGNRLNLNTPSPHLFPFLSKRLAQSKIDSETDIDVANTLVSLKRAAEQGRPRSLQCSNGWYGGARSRSPSPPEFGSERERELLKAKYRSLYRRDTPVIIVSHPSEDHTYSAARLPPLTSASDVDEEYDWGSDEEDADSFSDTSAADTDFSDCDSDGEGRVSPGKRKRRSYGGGGGAAYSGVGSHHGYGLPLKRRLIEAVDEDEEMKIVEGADALLNLAGIKTSGVTSLRTRSPGGAANNNNNNNNNDKSSNNNNSASPSSSQEAVTSESTQRS